MLTGSPEEAADRPGPLVADGAPLAGLPLGGSLRAWSRAGHPAATGAAAPAGAACFVLARLYLAAGGTISEFIRVALPWSRPGRVPAGVVVFPGDGYDGQFYYRLAVDPANLHRTAFGITMDEAFRLERIGYPALAWLVSLGRPGWVPVALVVVNLAAITVIGVAGGVLAADAGRPAWLGLLLAGYFGFFVCLGCDLTEPVAAACILGGLLAVRRGRPGLAGLLLGYGALTRETVLIVPLALAGTRIVTMIRQRGRPGRADAAWLLPVLIFAAWQLVLRAATGQFILSSGLGSNASTGAPFGAFAGALRLNAGLLWPATGAAYIWFAELAVLVAFTVTAIASLRATSVPVHERAALVAFVLTLGFLSASIWAGHADLRSVDDVYLLAVLVLLGSRRRLHWLAAGAATVAVIAAVHQALWL